MVLRSGGLGIAAIGVVLVLTLTDATRLLSTLWLIARVQPYEQAGSGAGHILVLGDSTGYGTGADRGADSVAGRLGAAYPDFRIDNDSNNGRTLADLRKRAAGVSGKFDLVLLQIGANDIRQGRPPEEALADLQQITEALADNTDQWVLISSGNVGAASAYQGDRARELSELSLRYRDAMARFADARAGFAYIDLYLPAAQDPFALQPERYQSIDGLHPSSEGYGIWFDKALPALRTALESPP